MELTVDKYLKDDQLLWRYMDLSKYISLLSTESLWLARSDTFKDQQEGKLPLLMEKELDVIYKKFESNKDEKINSAEDFKNALCSGAYINCWHKNADESMIMWEIYGQDTNLIAVQTTVKSLKSSIGKNILKGISFSLKSVDYSNHSEVDNPHYTVPFFVKRPYFNYENEARILLITHSIYDPAFDTPIGFPCSIDTKKFINKILVHPDSEQWFINVIESITKKYGVVVDVKRGLHGNT